MVMRKKAWLRVVEATLGIMILASVLLLMSARAGKRPETNIQETERFVLEQISKNDTLRSDILDFTDGSTAADQARIIRINNTINQLIPAHYSFDFRICGIKDACGIAHYPDRKEIFADEILITSTLTEYKPKKLKLFIWVT